MTDVHQCRTVDFLFVSLCFQNNILFALNFVQLLCRYFLKCFHFFIHCCFRTRNFHRLRQWNKHVHPIAVCHRIISFACDYDLHDLSVEKIPNVVSWTHEPPRCMLCFWILVGSTTRRFSFLKPGSASLFLLGGIAASIGTSNFLIAFLWFFFIHHLPDR